MSEATPVLPPDVDATDAEILWTGGGRPVCCYSVGSRAAYPVADGDGTNARPVEGRSSPATLSTGQLS